MARYINNEWVMDAPEPREPYFKIGDTIKVYGKEVVITRISTCHPVSGPIGCLLLKDQHLPDSYFSFSHYFLHWDRPIGANKKTYVNDDRYKEEIELPESDKRYRFYSLELPFTDEIPFPWKKYRKKRKKKIDLDWEYNEEIGEVTHHDIYIVKPSTFGVTRKEFHSFSYYGIASYIINYPFSFEEFKGGVKIYMSENNLRSYYDHPRFKGLDFRLYSSAEFGYIKVPRDHKLFPLIKEKFKNLFLI